MPQVVAYHITTLLRVAEVIKRTGFSKTTIDRLEKSGKFPKRRKIGIRAVAWDEQEIQNWINAKPFRVTIPDVNRDSTPERSR